MSNNQEPDPDQDDFDPQFDSAQRYRGNPIYDPQIERDYRKYYFQSRLDRMREDIEEIYGNRYDRNIEDL